MVSKKKKKVRSKFRFLILATRVYKALTKKYLIAVFIWRRRAIYDQKSCAQKAAIVFKRFPAHLYSKRHLPQRTSKSKESSKGPGWHQNTLSYKGYKVSSTRTHNMEAQRIKGKC